MRSDPTYRGRLYDYTLERLEIRNMTFDELVQAREFRLRLISDYAFAAAKSTLIVDDSRMGSIPTWIRTSAVILGFINEELDHRASLAVGELLGEVWNAD